MKKGDEHGYTLLEVMFVLTLVITVISLTSISVQPLYRHIKITHFIEQLQTDALFAQLHSISHHKNVYISFFPTKKKYHVYTDSLENSLIVRQYSEDIELEFATLPTTVMYIYNGNIRQSGKMFIKTKGATYAFVFLFGKGLTYALKQ